MENKKIQEVLNSFDREDIEKEISLASTFSEDYIKKTIEIERSILDLEKNRILKLDPAGEKTWAMYSFRKKVVATVKIRGSIFMTTEYVVQKSPSSAIEDVLEIALIINNVL